jgi:hypothetical protein
MVDITSYAVMVLQVLLHLLLLLGYIVQINIIIQIHSSMYKVYQIYHLTLHNII